MHATRLAVTGDAGGGQPCVSLRAGRLNGKLRILSHDRDTWRFPAIRGRLRCAGGAFHFFDAPDDFSGTRLDLLFEGDRLYLHGAQGRFGAVPITVNGDAPGYHSPLSHNLLLVAEVSMLPEGYLQGVML